MELSKEEQEAIKNLKLFLQKEENYMTNDKLEIILNLISKLQKENEKQSKVIDLLIDDVYDNDNFWKLKCGFEKIEKGKEKEYNEMLKTCNKKADIERIKAINERILAYEELLQEK